MTDQSQEPKVREWWIDEKPFRDAKNHIQTRCWASDFKRDDTVNVIERAEYDRLAGEVERLRKALELVSDQLEHVLLLDEQLADGWNDIKQISDAARKAAGGKKDD